MQPTDDDWGYFGGDNGVPTNNTDPIIGDIDDATPLNEDTVNGTLFGPIPQPSTGTLAYYGGAYRKLTSSLPGSQDNCRLYNRSGANLNVLSGIPQVVSTSSLDAGTTGSGPGVNLQVACVGKVSGVWVVQYLNLTGTTFSSDTSAGALTVDAGQAWRWEALLNGAPTTFWGDVGCYIGGQLCAVLRGKLNPRRGIVGSANRMCSAEVKIAVATAKNANISGTSRLDMPTTLGTYYPATFFGANGSVWSGSDTSLSLPGDPYVPGDYFGYAAEFTAISGIPAPAGDFEIDIALLGNPRAT